MTYKVRLARDGATDMTTPVIMGMGGWPRIFVGRVGDTVQIEVSNQAIVNHAQRPLRIAFTGSPIEAAEFVTRLAEELEGAGISLPKDATP